MKENDQIAAALKTMWYACTSTLRARKIKAYKKGKIENEARNCDLLAISMQVSIS